jgi:hypothetical protein
VRSKRSQLTLGISVFMKTAERTRDFLPGLFGQASKKRARPVQDNKEGARDVDEVLSHLQKVPDEPGDVKEVPEEPGGGP